MLHACSQVEVGRVKRQRRESQVVKDAIVGALQEEEASLVRNAGNLDRESWGKVLE